MAHETACSVRKSRLLVDGKYTVAECLPVSGVAHVCVTRQNACDHVYLFVFLCFRIKSARNTTIKEHTQQKKLLNWLEAQFMLSWIMRMCFVLLVTVYCCCFHCIMQLFCSPIQLIVLARVSMRARVLARAKAPRLVDVPLTDVFCWKPTDPKQAHQNCVVYVMWVFVFWRSTRRGHRGRRRDRSMSPFCCSPTVWMPNRSNDDDSDDDNDVSIYLLRAFFMPCDCMCVSLRLPQIVRAQLWEETVEYLSWTQSIDRDIYFKSTKRMI